MTEADRDYIEYLAMYLPIKSVDYVYNKIIEHNIKLKVSKPRNTKLGDYMAQPKTGSHRISVNSNLNKYSFLITFLHELAHLETWNTYKNKVDAHGKEWVSIFKQIITEVDDLNVFPKEVSEFLNSKMISTKGFAGNYKSKLSKLLSDYNDEKKTTLGEVGVGYRVTLQNGRQFDVLEKIRTRYKCRDVQNRRLYIVTSNAHLEEFIKIDIQ